MGLKDLEKPAVAHALSVNAVPAMKACSTPSFVTKGNFNADSEAEVAG